jgi:hypothetical protein
MIHFNELRLGKNVQQGQHMRCVVLTTTNAICKLKVLSLSSLVQTTQIPLALYCFFQFKATVGQIGRTLQQT